MENGKRIRVLTVKYTADIDYHEIPLFRGAVIASMNHEADVLFHNHIDNDKFRYSYPLIQYKRIGGKAAIVFINDAITNVGFLLRNIDAKYLLGKREIKAELENVTTESSPTVVADEIQSYKIINWLPLNAENYKRYMNLDNIIERVEMLQKILVGNIISMYKGLDVNQTDKINVTISDLYTPRTVVHKGIKLLSFDAEFKSNVSLPDNIGLGKYASLGCGTILKKFSKSHNPNEKKDNHSNKEEVPIFLLGGKDLEMETIKRILTNHECSFYDNELSWSNALISSYADIITDHPHRTIYAIELKADMTVPSNVIIIDHHNESRQQPSALEQVANILGSKLSRFHELVAANDKGYIPGMKAIDATEEEVAHIRLLDRHAQGVTEEEEEAAEADVANVKRDGRLAIVTTALKHFSPIVDRLYPYDRLLILADDELTYYGDGIDPLNDSLRSICDQVYYGGCGDNGYIGVSHTTPDVIANVKNIIIESKRC